MMDLSARIEAAVAAAIQMGQGRPGEVPGRLASALDYGVTPGGRADQADDSAERGDGLRG